MTPPPTKSIVLMTLNGQDAPGITSEITGLLAKADVQILDIGQAVIHNLLSLSILYETTRAQPAEKDLASELSSRANELGLKLELRELNAEEFKRDQIISKAHRYAITLIGECVSAQALSQVTGALARFNLNIDEIERLSDGDFGCVELRCGASVGIDQSHLKKELLRIAKHEGVDIAVQAEGLFRRAKRLVAFDMDSTLIQSEVIDEFARDLGCYAEVTAITEKAMGGQLDFDESLRLRVAKLKGLTTDQIETVYQRIELTPGADDLIRALRKLGYKTALISGGFLPIAERLKARLGIDYAFANQLEMENGVCTGKVVAPIVNAQRKADLLAQLAEQEQIVLDQVIAVGDGANDLPMLEKAGLGIAFNAKPAVRERAAMALNQKNLRSILYLLGISSRDLAEILN